MRAISRSSVEAISGGVGQQDSRVESANSLLMVEMGRFR